MYRADLCTAFLVAEMVKNLPAMQKTRVQFMGREDLQEKAVATHSSIFVRRIPGQRSHKVAKNWTWLKIYPLGTIGTVPKIHNTFRSTQKSFYVFSNKKNEKIIMNPAWITLQWSEVKWSKSRSVVSNSATSWTVQSMGFSRPEYWSGLPFPSPGNLPDPGIEPRSSALQADSLSSEPPGKPLFLFIS